MSTPHEIIRKAKFDRQANSMLMWMTILIGLGLVFAMMIAVMEHTQDDSLRSVKSTKPDHRTLLNPEPRAADRADLQGDFVTQ